MKKVYNINNLDCANCAQKIENSVRKIDGVEEVSVNFLMQKITLTVNDENFDEIKKKIKKICKKTEPDCTIDF